MKRELDLSEASDVTLPSDMFFVMASLDVKSASVLAQQCRYLNALIYPLVQAYKEPFESLTKTNSRLSFRFIDHEDDVNHRLLSPTTIGFFATEALHSGREVDLCFYRFIRGRTPTLTRLSVVYNHTPRPEVFLAFFVDDQRIDTLFATTLAHLLNYARYYFEERYYYVEESTAHYEELMWMFANPTKHDTKREINPRLH